MQDEDATPITARRIGLYLMCFAATWWLASSAYRWLANELDPSFPESSRLRGRPEVIAKLDYFAAHGREFDLVFVGDSRTYCGIAPSRIDPLLGTRSINLAYYSHWFPTQLPQLQELLPRLAPGTTLVWSIGHQNFRRASDELGHVYPIGLSNVPRYLRWGFSWSALQRNLIDGLPGGTLFTRRGEIRAHVDRVLGRRIAAWPHGGPQPAAASLPDPVASEIAQWKARPDTVWLQPLRDHGKTTSLEVYERAGNYVRVELDPEYFRARQTAVERERDRLVDGKFAPDPEYWQIFLGIVELLERSRVHLIVNEVEEAPYFYRSSPHPEAYRAFMREIRSFFEERGIPYVRVDWETFEDRHYFDYNHLNSSGIEKYSPLLASALRPHLRRD